MCSFFPEFCLWNCNKYIWLVIHFLWCMRNFLTFFPKWHHFYKSNTYFALFSVFQINESMWWHHFQFVWENASPDYFDYESRYKSNHSLLLSSVIAVILKMWTSWPVFQVFNFIIRTVNLFWIIWKSS